MRTNRAENSRFFGGLISRPDQSGNLGMPDPLSGPISPLLLLELVRITT